MPSSFAGFSREDALRQLAEEQKAEAEQKRKEAERAAAEKKRLEDLARGNAWKGSVVPFSGVVLDNIEFGASSAERLNQPDAVSFAAKYGILQSLGEAVYARKMLNDDASWEYQRTRTGAFYVVENGKAYVAFDDILDKEKNVVIAFAQEGCDKNAKGEEIFIDGSVLDNILKRAKDTKRFLEVPEQSPIEASVVGSPCEYETNPYFVAVLEKMAGVNAELIRSKKCETGRLYVLNASIVKGGVVDGKGLVVRPVGLGGVCDYVSSVVAGNGFNGSGRARGVRPAQKTEGGAR
jgi:hypothetical protein